MGAPIPEMNPVEDASAEALLSSLKTIAATERRKHASVFNYWLSIRRDRQFPPIRDLDPLEISDAGPFSVLLEMIGAEDADIRHVGQAIKFGVEAEKVSEALPRRCLPASRPGSRSSRRARKRSPSRTSSKPPTARFAAGSPCCRSAPTGPSSTMSTASSASIPRPAESRKRRSRSRKLLSPSKTRWNRQKPSRHRNPSKRRWSR